jgi:hypothetical protein
MAGGESHAYRIGLRSGQYLKVVIEQRGIDVVVRLFGPDVQKLTEVDNDPAVGMESIFVVAEISGQYRLEVQSSKKAAKAGRYEARIEELRHSYLRLFNHAPTGPVPWESLRTQ